MYPLGLRTKIAFTLLLLLGLSMVLLDFVMMISVQRILLKSEVAKAYQFISLLDDNLQPDLSRGIRPDLKDPDYGSRFARLLREGRYDCGMYMDRGMSPIHFLDNRCDLNAELKMHTRRSVLSGDRSVGFYGESWSVFWKQKSHVVISAPVFEGRRQAGAIGVVLGLDDLYFTLRQVQKILFLYILINALLFTFFGVTRISRITVKPLYRLLRRAESFREDDSLFFSNEKEDNEFNQLSKALNRMLNRISEDKNALQSTVDSLEVANLELKQAQRDVLQAEKLSTVGRLSAGIAHEIGNPISIVMGYFDLLRQPDVSEEERLEFIDRSEREIGRVHRIIQQLVHFSKPFGGEPPRPISLHKLIGDVIELVRHQPMMAGMRTVIDLAAEQDTVQGDEAQLQQVFLNLVINAADAITANGRDQGGELMITSETVVSDDGADEPFIQLNFRDNGVGIPEEQLKDIFDPFFTTKEPGKGTGLGLSTAFVIIENLGGRIRALSDLGKGTTVMVQLPLHPGKPRNLTASPDGSP